MITLGCDPELFLADAAGALRSSIERIGGSKAAPAQLVDLGDGFAVQEDNVAVEFNIPPADSFNAFNDSIQRTITYLERAVQARYGFHFSRLSAALFPREELDHPAAMEFGCDPDFNAWTGERNPRPKAADPTLRSCGGHIHIGISGLKKEDKMRLGRLMDLYAGVPSCLMDNGELRKELYGKRGAMRFKKYGMEYRVLSNYWIFEERTRRWAWDVTNQAVDALQRGIDVQDFDAEIEAAINNNNKEVAARLVQQHNLMVV